MIILQEAINTFSFSPHIDKESPADKPVTCLRDFFRQNRTRAASRLKLRGFCLSTLMNPADTSELMWWEIVEGDRPMPLKKAALGQTTIWSSARCCIPNCCMKSVGSPASAARVCAAAASNSA